MGKNMVQGIWNGISNAVGWIVDKIKGFCSGIVNKIKEFFGIHSPSTLFRDEVGNNLALGIGEGFTEEMKNVSAEMKDAIPTTFDTKTNINSNTRAGTNGAYTYFDMVSAFKQALGEMKIELDDENVGKFVDKTVTKLIYT